MTKTAFAEDTQIDSGIVIMWAGTLSNIPSGWALCDGNNGTSDLTGRFVKGHPNDGTTPGNTGGADSITLSVSQLPSHSHTGSTDTSGNHNHGVEWDSFSAAVGADHPGHGTGGTSESNTKGSHTHTVDFGSTGSGSSIENRPPFYEVAFIQKL